MNIKIDDYIIDSIVDGPGIRLTFNCNKDGHELDFNSFKDLVDKAFQFEDINGVTFNDIEDLNNDSPLIPYLKFLNSRRLDIRITSDIKFEELLNSLIIKHIQYYNDGREIDVQKSRKQNKIIRC